MPRNDRCSVLVAEEIAIVISAMMNTSGGVLEVQIDTENLMHDGLCETELKVFESHIVRIIATQENWIPKRLFSSCVKSCVQGTSKICFFVNRSSDLITHHTCAYTCEDGEAKLITDHDVTCRMLRECYYKGENKCRYHKDRQYRHDELKSALPDTEKLIIDTGLPNALRPQYVCRYYQLHEQPMTEVLCTQSIRNDIKELVSALANTGGGSIFLGVTYTDTHVVKGYTLGAISKQQLKECLSRIINGQTDMDITIWSTVNHVQASYEDKTNETWKLFFHQVYSVSGSYVDRDVIEIRVRKCPGGMFCALPLCYEVSHCGDIIPLNDFEEWKEKMLLTYKSESKEVVGKFEDHFSQEVMIDADLPSEVEHPAEQTAGILPTMVENEVTNAPEVFQWWLNNNDAVISESLCFYQCCARELASEAMDIQKPFMFSPLYKQS